MNYSHAPLHDDDLEQAVLGTMLVDEHGLRIGLSLLREGAPIFYQPTHRVIFQALHRLHADGKAVSAMSTVRQLTTDGNLTKAGGAPEVMGLMGKAQSTAKLDTHCKYLLELRTKRRVGEIARRLIDKANDPMQDCFELLGEATSSMSSLHESLQLKRSQHISELYAGVIEKIRHAVQQPDGLTGIPSGLASLDRVTGGWQPSDLIILAARPAMGKTTLAVFMARVAADKNKYPGVIFSLEMSSEQLVMKMIATEAGYTTSQLQKGKLQGGLAEVDMVAQKSAALTKAGIILDDTAGVSIGEMTAKVARLIAEYGIKWVVVDYLQLMTGEKKGNREQEIGSISRGLKMIAKEHKIPVIALAQLSRSVETRGGDKKPMLSDLRESGAIEQDADVIVFPFRPEYYGVSEDENGNPTKDTTEIIIAKHRNGALANVIVSSNMGQGKYSDLDTSIAPPGPFRSGPSDFDETPF